MPETQMSYTQSLSTRILDSSTSYDRKEKAHVPYYFDTCGPNNHIFEDYPNQSPSDLSRQIWIAVLTFTISNPNIMIRPSNESILTEYVLKYGRGTTNGPLNTQNSTG